MYIIRRWLPLIFWVILIFGLSSIPDISSGGMELPKGSDKVVHYIEYAVLALFMYRGLVYDRKYPGMMPLLATLLTATGIASLDEYYQSFIPGRDASALDLVADCLGIVTGALIYHYITRRLKGRIARS